MFGAPPVYIAYLVFVALGAVSFRLWRPRTAALVVFLGGWLVLPVGVFPAGAADAVFPYWITGLAVPSDMLLTKAWVAPVVALLGALAFDQPGVRRLRPVVLDAPVVLWCLWPLAQGLMSGQGDPPALISSLYLAGSWGAPWLLGRLYFARPDGQQQLMRGLTWSALACLPIAVIEGVVGPGLVYEALYGPHPFHADGAQRYLGFRPLGCFENGNQYGLWVSLCAVAAVWLARSASGDRRNRARIQAAVVVLMALAAQSVGAVVLMFFGIGLLFSLSLISLKRLTVAAMAVLVLGGTVYLSGAVPVRQLATGTTAGRAVVDAFRGVGRGSLTWRVSQDQKLLRGALAHPLAGSGHWDWWRPEGVRPWGLPLLVTGQFGLVGLALCFGLMLAPAVRTGLYTERRRVWRPQALPTVLATLVMLSMMDALLNSFIFFPAVLAAGALGGAGQVRTDDDPMVTRIPARAAA